MPVLIDGNNLLHAAQDAEDPEHPLGRAKLCEFLGAWSRRTGERVQLVFDGPEPPDALGQQIADPNISVRYSGRGISADAVLIEIIEEDSAARRLVVVSSDRAIAKVARRRRARAMRSPDFWVGLRAELARPERRALEPPAKRHGLSRDEAAWWLREMGFGDSGIDSTGPEP